MIQLEEGTDYLEIFFFNKQFSLLAYCGTRESWRCGERFLFYSTIFLAQRMAFSFTRSGQLPYLIYLLYY